MKTLNDEVHYAKDGKLDDNSKHFPIFFGCDIKDFLQMVKTKIISKQGVSAYVLNGNDAVDIIDELSGFALQKKAE